MSTSVPIRWSRALSTLFAGLLAVAAVTAAGYAASAALSQTTDASGSVCGSAWHFHTGSGAEVSGAELTSQQRARASLQCARSGDADWQRALRFGRLAAGAGAAAIVFALWARFAPAVPRSARKRRRPAPHPVPAPPGAWGARGAPGARPHRGARAARTAPPARRHP